MKNPIDALERAVRKAEECLGTDIFIRRDGDATPIQLDAYDDDLRGRRFSCELGPPSKYEAQAKAFHESIYRARGQEAFRRQRGLCAICGKKMQGTANTEIDHIQTRAKGRDDSIQNLQVVHGEPCHRLKHRPPPNMKGPSQ